MKITIALANYNHAAYIAQCINGMRAQTHTNWELIVHDDGSKDNSREIIEELAKQDVRIRPVFFTKNRGAIAAIQTVTMDACRGAESGELFMSVAADDYISDCRFFERAVQALERYPSAAGAFARATLVDGNTGRPFWRLGHYGFKLPFMHAGRTLYIPPQKSMTAFLAGKLFVPGAAVVWRTSLFAGMGGYDETLGPQSDYFLNHALAAVHGVAFIDRAGVTIREFKSSYSGSASDRDYFRCHALMEKKLRELDLPYKVDGKLFRKWRESVVKNRIKNNVQFSRLNKIYIACKNIKDRERRSYTPNFIEFLNKIENECFVHLSEERLENRRRYAEGIFAELAGPAG